MSYEVRLTIKAHRQLMRAAKWWAKHRSAAQAERWVVGFLRAINGLSQRPEQQPLARENQDFLVELRELRYGQGKRPTHRAIFVIRPNGDLYTPFVTYRNVISSSMTCDCRRFR